MCSISLVNFGKIMQKTLTFQKVILYIFLWTFFSCDDITVCEVNESDNVCESNSDCLLAFCGINCCPCELAVSTKQFESTYCMATVDQGFEFARRHCEEARNKACDAVECRDSPCPHPLRAVCDNGRCIGGY